MFDAANWWTSGGMFLVVQRRCLKLLGHCKLHHGRSRAFLAARLVRRGDANVDVVSGLISDCKKKRIGIRSMKVDREFFSVGMMHLLEQDLPN